MSKSVPCICIDAKNKPKEIPQEKWPVEGDKYHINHVFIMVNQNGIQGCELSEFDISMHAPYNCYRLSRFAFKPEDLGKLIALIKECAQLNGIPDINIEELTRELETVD
tara:strand:- start:107 stop:433 length:327 start_codon:yes stop_codon:yes gene_type:complete